MNIAVLGSQNIGKTTAALAKNGNHMCVIHDILDNEFPDIQEPWPFLITRIPDMPRPYIRKETPYVNYGRHRQTCDKKRKARKRKK